MLRAVLAAGFWALFAVGFAFADPCQLGRVGALDIVWQNNRALAPVSINGQQVIALLDTGASRSSLFRNEADRLGLSYSIVNDRTAHGFGGASRIYSARINELRLAGETASDLRLDVLDSNWPPPIGMIIGQNLLSSDNIELDFVAGKVTFFRTRGDCHQTALAYWPEDWSVIDMMNRDDAGSVRAEVQLNGQTMRALFDTGAPTSLVTLDAARRLGVTPESEDVTADRATGGIGARRLQTWLGRFTSFQIGGEAISNARLRIVDTNLPGASHMDFDMILGADFFRSHRVMFAYSQNKIYFVYLGGHVFQVVGPVELPDQDPTAPEAAEGPAPH